MIPCYLAFAIILAAVPGYSADPPKRAKIAATEKRAPLPTLNSLIDHVLKNGVDRPIKAPLSRSLGFSSDVVPTKALRHKSKASPDKRTHAIYVAFDKDKAGKLFPRDFVLISGLISEKDGKKYIDGFNFRADISGRLLAAVKSTGLMDDVDLTVLSPDSPEAVSGFSVERSLHLEKLDMLKLEK